MGMQHEPGYIPPAGKTSQAEKMREARYAQAEAAALYERARKQRDEGRFWLAECTQTKACNVQRAARYFMGLPRG